MNIYRWLYIAFGATGLLLVYLFQDYLDFYTLIVKWEPPTQLDYATSYATTEAVPFIINKAGRYLLNDLLSICIIYGIFGEKKYAQFAMYVMLFGLFVLLPVYIALYLGQPQGYSSMVSHLHRVVMNPVLMMLLIPAFIYQKRVQQ